jgi:hypothetical protein
VDSWRFRCINGSDNEQDDNRGGVNNDNDSEEEEEGDKINGQVDKELIPDSGDVEEESTPPSISKPEEDDDDGQEETDNNSLDIPFESLTSPIPLAPFSNSAISR